MWPGRAAVPSSWGVLPPPLAAHFCLAHPQAGSPVKDNKLSLHITSPQLLTYNRRSKYGKEKCGRVLTKTRHRFCRFFTSCSRSSHSFLFLLSSRSWTNKVTKRDWIIKSNSRWLLKRACRPFKTNCNVTADHFYSHFVKQNPLTSVSCLSSDIPPLRYYKA